MANFPFYRHPYNRYYGFPSYQPLYNNMNIPNATDKSADTPINDTEASNNLEEDKPLVNKKNSSRYNSFGPIHFQNPFSMDAENPILEILGIKLYLDDIVILSLLFFLYKEGVKDEMLFLSLILLLLS